MTEVVIVLVAVAIVAAVAVRVWATMRPGREPVDDVSGRGPRDPWLVEADEVVRSGLLLVEDLEPVVSGQPGVAPGGSMAHEPIGRLDDLTHRLAELATSAPTAMDGRVCRNAAVRTRTLGDALQHSSRDPTAARRPVTDRAVLIERRAECRLALHDLAEHVQLL